MTFEQLIYFHEIVKEHTFSEAAFTLNISQSSLSKQIAKLEQELNIKLFDRTHRKITLTEEGKILHKYSEIFLKDYQQFINELNLYKTNEKNELRIAILPVLSQHDFGNKLHNFMNKYPEIKIVMQEIEERDFSSLLLHNENDVYLLRGEHPKFNHFKRIPLYKDQLVAVVSKNHPLSNNKKICLSQLKDEELMLPPAYTQISKIAKNACIEAGFQPNVIRYGRVENILAFVSLNHGVALLMEHSLHMFQHNLHVLHFDEPIYGNINLFIAPHAEKKDCVQKLLSFL